MDDEDRKQKAIGFLLWFVFWFLFVGISLARLIKGR
jgi:hypothetical protein